MILRRRAFKASVVLGGIAVAAVIAWLIVSIDQRLTQGPDAVASSGMYAFGDLVLAIGVFGLLALPSIILTLVWLRPVARFWIVAAWIAGLYAATGPVGLLVSGWLRESAGTWVILSDARIGIMPLGGTSLLIGCIFAPQVNHRLLLLFGALLDGGIFAGIVLFKFILPGL